MNTENNTVVNAEFFKKLKDAGLDADYFAVPKEMEGKIQRHLAGREIADIDEPTKNELKNAAVAEGNRRHEEALRKGMESEIVQAQLEQLRRK